MKDKPYNYCDCCKECVDPDDIKHIYEVDSDLQLCRKCVVAIYEEYIGPNND